MLPSGLHEHIIDEEDLARFLTQSSQYNTTMVKPSAFLPTPNDQETSISRHGRDPGDTLWTIGRVAAGPRRLHGAAIFKAHAVRRAALDVLSAEPPDRHGVIRGWPCDPDPEFQKAQHKERAIMIASAADLLLLD